MTRRILLLLMLVSPVIAQGQTTTTTGTIVDSNGNPYSNGTASAQKAVASGQVQPPPVNVTTNGSGTFSMILPSPASYIFTICAPPTQIGPTGNPTPTSVCFNNTAPVAVSGASQDVSSSLNAVAKVLGPNITGVSGVVANCTANQVPFYAVNGNVVACSSVITISGSTATVQNETVTGNEAVNGTNTITGALAANGGATVNNGIVVNGGSTLNGGGTDSGAWTHAGNHAFNGATMTVNSTESHSGAETHANINGYVFVTGTTAAAVNTAIQSLPGSGVGGTIYLPCNTDIFTSGATITVDRPLTMMGCNSRVGPIGTRLVSNDSNIPLSLTNNQAFGVTLRNFGICGNAGTSAAVGADLDNNVADVTLDHVYIGTCGGTFSVAGVRVGNRTTGAPVLNVAFHNTVVTGAPVGYLILRANDVRTYSAKAYDNTTAQMQIGDATHLAINIQNYDPDFEPNTQTAATDVIVLNASNVKLDGGYHEISAAGKYFIDIPNTATLADNIIASGCTIRGNAVATVAFHTNLASATLTVRDCALNNFAVSPTYFINDASKVITVEAFRTDTATSTLVGGTQATSGFSYFDANQGSVTGSQFYNQLVALALSPRISGGISTSTPTFGSTGFQHLRVTGCATAAALNATCDTTFTWTSPFANASYTATCTGEGVTSGVPIVEGAAISGAKSGTAMTVRTLAVTAAAAQFTQIDCTAVHD